MILKKLNDLKYFKDLSFKYSLENYGKSYNRFITLTESNFLKVEKLNKKNS